MTPFELFSYMSLAGLSCELLITITGVTVGGLSRAVRSWKDHAT
jgi:hypothetical protein